MRLNRYEVATALEAARRRLQQLEGQQRTLATANETAAAARVVSKLERVANRICGLV